jgi:hypothetical protein
MTESGSSTASSDEEVDPGRDPKGLNPPRNLFGGGGTGQDSGQGTPEDNPGTEGESMVPEAPEEDDGS